MSGSPILLLVLALLRPSGAAEIAAEERRSGYEFMSAQTRAMQDDEAANPATLWLLDGEALWTRKDGAAGVACANCHGDAATTMRGVAARYPAFDAALARPLDLEQRINVCRTGAQKAAPFDYESRELLALTAYVARQSRGTPIRIEADATLQPFLDRGRVAYERRQGQLNLSCAQCHDQNWSRTLAGNPITQAHPTGYPLYRLEWQSLGSLQRRLRNCLAGVRAETYPFGAPELVELELYLMWRARGMEVETPAVRP
ncbi:MAG TPA: sulfur oxidation c-type cytochrome SoxA [Burkholderiaceae bacterium]|nr:sulfur oxidation c-type cytochrome SoxA [Burkholderiaceae bacterium]